MNWILNKLVCRVARWGRGALLLGLLLLGLFAMALPGYAQVTPTDIGTCTNLPAIINAATCSNQTCYIPIWQGRGLALQATFCASEGISNVTYCLAPQLALNSTNRATVGAWQWVVPANLTTNVVAVTNWSADQLAGFVGLNLYSITNAHATAIVTNKGVLYSRPY